jgi:hypothetical protein
MLHTAVFTGFISAFYSFLRYLNSLFTVFSRGEGDLESGLHQNGVIVSGSRATESSSFHCQGLRDSAVYTGPFGEQHQLNTRCVVLLTLLKYHTIRKPSRLQSVQAPITRCRVAKVLVHKVPWIAGKRRGILVVVSSCTRSPPGD